MTGPHSDIAKRRGPSPWVPYVLMGVFVVVGFVLNQRQVDRIDGLAHANQQTTFAVCELRSDLKRRVANSIRFLQEHPDGIPGISPKDIQMGIDNQQRTIVALGALKCPKPTP